MTTPVMKKQTKPHNCGVVVSPAPLEGLRSDALRAVHAIEQRQRSAPLAKATTRAAQPT
jgi:hypothetical protein